MVSPPNFHLCPSSSSSSKRGGGERGREEKREETFPSDFRHHPSTSLSLHGSSVITSYFSIPPISPPFFVLRHRLSSIDRSPCRRTPRLCRACLQHDMCNIYVHGCIGATGVTTIDLSSLYARRIRYFFPFFFYPSWVAWER